MKHELRTMVAFIVARYINTTSNYVKIYDEQKTKYVPCNMLINNYGFNAYDYDRCSYLNGCKGLIYDFDTKETVNVFYNGINFSGFELSTKNEFRGIVNGDKVTIYDKEFDKNFNYSLI